MTEHPTKESGAESVKMREALTEIAKSSTGGWIGPPGHPERIQDYAARVLATLDLYHVYGPSGAEPFISEVCAP